MLTMDLKCKGITWVGNICQKLESMYLEVEDIMYQETTKYVENQVQSAGESVKKIYAELMQDLLPPSSVDPVRGKYIDSPIEQNADVGTCKKSKEGIEVNPMREKPDPPKELQAVAPDGKDLTHGSSFSGLPIVNHLSHLPFVNPIKGAGTNLSLKQNDDVEIYEKSKVGIEENAVKEKPPSSKVSELIAPTGKVSRGASLLSGVQNENNETTCNIPTNMSTLTSVKVTKCNVTPEAVKIRIDLLDATECVPDFSSARPTSDLVLPVLSCENKIEEIGLTPSRGIQLIESNGMDTSTTYNTMSLMGSSGNGQGHYNDYAELQATLSPPEIGRSDGYNSEEMAEGNDETSSGMETIKKFDNRMLEESCILVDSNELPFVSQRTGKPRSYKKKFRDAFASKMRSKKKQEYEQLAVWCGDIDTGIVEQRVEVSTLSNVTRDLDSQKLPIHDFCESEWELL